MAPPEQGADKSTQAPRADSEKAALLQRRPEPPRSTWSSTLPVVTALHRLSERSRNLACWELMLAEAMNTPLTSIIPLNSASLHPSAPEQPAPEIQSFLLESSADSSLIRGFSDLTKVTPGGSPGVLTLPALSSTANFHAA